MRRRKVALDQTFAFDEPWISDAGTVLQRASGDGVDDVALVRSAGGEGFAAVVFLDEGCLLSPSIHQAAREEQIAVVATRDRDPWRAAELVQHYADDIGRLQPGALRRLLASGLQNIEPRYRI